MNYILAALSAGVLAFAALPAFASTSQSAPFFVPSATSVDAGAHTATFPLHRGTAGGKAVWYILTDASDASVAKANGLAFAPDLASLGSAAASAAGALDAIQYPGAPDFTPQRSYVPSAMGFPPATAAPGGVADLSYSPFVAVGGVAGIVNAPIVATGDGPFDVTTHTNTEDRVIAIDTQASTVTLVLAQGFVAGKPVLYVSTEASDPTAATVERATYVPRLAKADAGAAIPIGVVVNGPRTDAPQGLAYLALDTPLGENATADNVRQIGSPFNVLSLVPDVQNAYATNGYSPLWNVFVVPTPQPARLTTYAEVAPLAKPAGFFVNCPAIAYGVETR